jgi:hypothetical protein
MATRNTRRDVFGLEAQAQLHGALHRLQRLTERHQHGVRARRALHDAAALHQQRVVEQLAQAAQRLAHGRLRHARAARGARDAALAQERVEGHQRVQLEAVQERLGHPRV